MYKTTYELEREIQALKEENLQLRKQLYSVQNTRNSSGSSGLDRESKQVIATLIQYYNFTKDKINMRSFNALMFQNEVKELCYTLRINV